jgi:endothelin-converting enzyme/putative endopeptidase
LPAGALLGLLWFAPGRAETPCAIIAGTAPVSGEFAPQGLDVRTLSKSVPPGDDFFSYVNAGWIAATPIPSGYWDYGQTSVLIARVDQQLATLLEGALARRGPRGSVERQVGDAYASFLDAAAIERRGAAKLRAEVRQLLKAQTHESVARWMAHPGSSSLIAINIFPAERQWRVHLDQQNVSQAMLGLPNPDDYRRTDAGAVTLRGAYVAYVSTLLDLAGLDGARVRAERLLALETKIAGNLWPFEKLRDRKANYHPMTVDELVSYAPGFPWRAFLDARSVGRESQVVLGTDTAVQAQAQLFADTTPDDWTTYLVFHWIQNHIELLPEAYRRASWEFHGRTMSNAKEPPPREKEAARLVSTAMGLQLGKLYAQHYVSEQTRAAAEEMITYLRKAFAERLAMVPWMDEGTRAKAQLKFARFEFKVGYPKIWRDFGGVRIERDDAAGNLQRLREADWRYQLRRLRPGFRDEFWYHTPQTVDASYSKLFNAIELPGAFLQPPYFDAAADPAVNFGAIGAIVGHEIGHGFDEQGIVYDPDGRIREWWPSSVLEQFHRRSEALIAQYDAFAPYPDAHVDGRRTLDENIADLSGVLLAHRAYQLYQADHACPQRASLDGLTGEQRFFMSWAQAWRYQAPESAIRHVIKYGSHSPTPYRVNGVVQNIDAWYEAFGVHPGQKLFVPPEKRVRIW